MVADSLSELRGPEHGVPWLPIEPAWSGRREFDLDDGYDRAAAYKIARTALQAVGNRGFVLGVGP